MPHRHLPVQGFGPDCRPTAEARPSREHDAGIVSFGCDCRQRSQEFNVQVRATRISHAKDAFPLAASLRTRVGWRLGYLYAKQKSTDGPLQKLNVSIGNTSITGTKLGRDL